MSSEDIYMTMGWQHVKGCSVLHVCMPTLWEGCSILKVQTSKNQKKFLKQLCWFLNDFYSD